MVEAPATLITGGANGIGAAMVRRFTAAGYRVAVADVDTTSGRELAAETGCHFIHADVGVLDDNKAAVAETVARFGGLDIVCLNAGIPSSPTLGADFDAELYRRAMRINLDGHVYGANAAIPQLRHNGGSILITSSLAGITGSPDLYYGTAKHALIGLARSLAVLLGPDGITVNALCPGFIATRLLGNNYDVLTKHGFAIAEPEQVAEVAENVLDSGETGQAWEVQAGRPASAVKFPHVSVSTITDSPEGTNRDESD